MSLNRLIYYGTIIGGWSAFVGWLLGELLFGGESSRGFFAALMLFAFVGATIAGALSALPAVVNGQWQQALNRLGIGLGGGFAAGLLSGLLGGGFYGLLKLIAGRDTAFVRILGLIPGWVLLGVAVGAVEGAYERSLRKLRNGMIGGAVGGFVGGLLFDPITWLLHSGTGMASRALAFVILGMCIGLLIAVVQVVLKEAWLTVVDGYRPGRQVILGDAETFMGTAERISLTFIAFGAKGVEPRHVRIVRQPNGSYVVLDNNTRTGTKINGYPLTGPALLRDGDVISFGINQVRFSERRRGFGVAPTVAPAAPVRPAIAHPVQPVMVTPIMIQPAPQPRPVPVTPVAAPIRPGPPPGPPVVTPIAVPPARPAPAPARPPTAQPPAPPRQPAAPPAQAWPPVAAPPAAPPPVQPRPVTPQPPAQPKPPARPAGASDLCPNCGIKAPGTPGNRVCMICGTKF